MSLSWMSRNSQGSGMVGTAAGSTSVHRAPSNRYVPMKPTKLPRDQEEGEDERHRRGGDLERGELERPRSHRQATVVGAEVCGYSERVGHGPDLSGRAVTRPEQRNLSTMHGQRLRHAPGHERRLERGPVDDRA